MYLAFYGLQEKPFNTTPDPRFLFLTAGHKEALAQLLYGVQEGKGFLVLTAEVGTGKTTLLHTLLQRLPEDTEVAFVFNSMLSFDEILEYVLEDFGVTAGGSSQAQRLFALNNFLIDRRRAGRDTVLILDEAQNLDADTLERVRLLSNFETPTEKLLQILLVGQPELQAKLQLPALRQLKQRIGLRCRLPVLTPAETCDYIRHRLQVAGASNLGLFTDRAVARISDYAGGIPRVINIVCDHCLLIGYADQQRQIGPDVVEQVVEYLEAGERPLRKWWAGVRWSGPLPLHWQRGVALTAVLLGGVFVLTWQQEALATVSSLLAEHLHDLAFSAHALLSKILVGVQEILSKVRGV